jgi:hypothetical protein
MTVFCVGFSYVWPWAAENIGKRAAVEKSVLSAVVVLSYEKT